MANDPHYATSNHLIVELGINGESAIPRVGMSPYIFAVAVRRARGTFQFDWVVDGRVSIAVEKNHARGSRVRLRPVFQSGGGALASQARSRPRSKTLRCQCRRPGPRKKDWAHA